MAVREKLWVVRPGDGTTVAEVLARAKEGVAAIEEGRVFIGKKRATSPTQSVRPGDAVRIGAGRDARGPTSTMSSTPSPPIELLFETDGLVACVKPAGLPTVPDHAGASHALVALVARALGRPTEDLRVTSRLDREVSGVVIFALDGAAEERLRLARAEGRYKRRYIALASTHGGGLDEEGVWTAPIGRGPDPRLRVAGDPSRTADGMKPAVTRWRRVDVAARAAVDPEHAIAMLAVDPVSGRTHQIRVHAANAHAPLVGDRDYGGPGRIVLASGRVVAPSRIALHAAQVTVPGLDGPLVARAPIPEELRALWSALGGDDTAWGRAIGTDTPPAEAEDTAKAEANDDADG